MYVYIPDDATEDEVDELSAWHWNRLFEQRYQAEMPIRPAKSWLEAI